MHKWIVCCGILLIFSAKICLAQENKEYDVTLEGYRVSSEINAIEKDGQKFVNLPFLRKYFRIATSWSPSDNELFFKFGNLNFKFFADKKTYTVNGASRALPAAPFEKDNELWIPLDFLLRLGMKLTDENKHKIALEWDQNFLLGVENISYQERPAFLLIGNKNFTVRNYTLSQPDRLICEIENFKPHFAVNPVIASTNPLVKQVRVKKEDNGKTVLVFELKKASSFKLVQDPKQPTMAILVFNYLVEDVCLTKLDQECKIGIKTSLPADYKVTSSNRELVVKFSGATFNEGSKTILENNNRFRSIKINQDDPSTVSVTFELATDEQYFVNPARDNPHLLEVKNMRTIKSVQWDQTKSGSTLTINANGELTETIRTIATSRRLQIDLECSQFSPDLNKSISGTDQVKEINLTSVSPTLARIDIDLKYLPSYQLEYSQDRSSLMLHINNSTIVGKTIILDPGHGGPDTGACGKLETREKDLNLEVAMRLKNYLEQAGAEVLLTRNSDSFIGLYERCYFSNYHKADLFISIHTNSHPDPNIRGIEVFYYSGQDKSCTLATSIFRKITSFTRFNRLGIKTARFVVIRETQMPSALVELGFLSNYQEESILRTVNYKDKAALGIFQGIVDYFLK